MSENVTSIGVMVPLAHPNGGLHDPKWEELQQQYDNLGLYMNYEGTLLFSEETHHEGCGIFFSQVAMKDNLIALCKENNISIKEEYAQFYVSNWYNGADSHQSEITLQQFNESLN